MLTKETLKQLAVSSQRIQHTGTTPSVHQVPLHQSKHSLLNTLLLQVAVVVVVVAVVAVEQVAIVRQ
jgi:hypothetical protein